MPFDWDKEQKEDRDFTDEIEKIKEYRECLLQKPDYQQSSY